MAAKKDPYKFTIQFNPADPTHLQTAALLNRQGRRKAQFLVNAVMHYIHCSQTPDIPQEPPLDTKLIETVVRQILKGTANHAPCARTGTTEARLSCLLQITICTTLKLLKLWAKMDWPPSPIPWRCFGGIEYETEQRIF